MWFFPSTTHIKAGTFVTLLMKQITIKSGNNIYHTNMVITCGIKVLAIRSATVSLAITSANAIYLTTKNGLISAIKNNKINYMSN